MNLYTFVTTTRQVTIQSGKPIEFFTNFFFSVHEYAVLSNLRVCVCLCVFNKRDLRQIQYYVTCDLKFCRRHEDDCVVKKRRLFFVFTCIIQKKNTLFFRLFERQS